MALAGLTDRLLGLPELTPRILTLRLPRVAGRLEAGHIGQGADKITRVEHAAALQVGFAQRGDGNRHPGESSARFWAVTTTSSAPGW